MEIAALDLLNELAFTPHEVHLCERCGSRCRSKRAVDNSVDGYLPWTRPAECYCKQDDDSEREVSDRRWVIEIPELADLYSELGDVLVKQVDLPAELILPPGQPKESAL